MSNIVSRRGKQKVLQSLIRERYGLNISQVASKAHVNRITAAHWLRHFLKQGLLIKRMVGTSKVYILEQYVKK